MANLLRKILFWLYFAAFRKFGKSKTRKGVWINICGMIAFSLTILKQLERGSPLFMMRSSLCGIKMCARQAIVNYFK